MFSCSAKRFFFFASVVAVVLIFLKGKYLFFTSVALLASFSPTTQQHRMQSCNVWMTEADTPLMFHSSDWLSLLVAFEQLSIIRQATAANSSEVTGSWVRLRYHKCACLWWIWFATLCNLNILLAFAISRVAVLYAKCDGGNTGVTMTDVCAMLTVFCW